MAGEKSDEVDVQNEDEEKKKALIRRPPNQVTTHAISSLLFTRNREARLLPLSFGILGFESPDDDSQDDDIDMLDRNSVASSSSRPATARRSTVHGASSSDLDSSSMSTGNANSTTSAKTTAKTSSTMAGFLKRKDNASDQGNKRPKLQAGSGSAGAAL
ncbi:hypothetical protein BJ165DRAFT_1529209 [Panaeolus papilionaceus]|nr:hypothetical protein BJ165DRAFT_1529209 [Panaeolus papilionaceus]